MRSHPGSFDLRFLLPRGIRLANGILPLPRGCQAEIEGGLVRVRGDSREHVFDDAAGLVSGLAAARPLSISAILYTPSRPSGFDRWHIIAGADVAFSPTALDPYFPRQVA
jgi:hypothetical protein